MEIFRSDKRHIDVNDYVKKHGKDAAAKHFNISRESVRRYCRHAETTDGKPIDENKSKLIDRISKRFSEKELKALLDDSFRPKPGEATYNFDGDTVKIGIISDTHIGSSFTNENRLRAALDECVRQEANLVLMSGDITEGMSGRDGHVYELTHIGYQAQRQAAINIFSDYHELYIKMISGNHDLWYAQKANMGALIVADICDALPCNCEYLGEHEAKIYVNGAKVMLWHGEDGSSYALSYRSQKIIEALQGGQKPQLLILGHDHKQINYMTRNVHVIGSGCIQDQTPWMRRKRMEAHCGFWIIEPTIKEKEIKRLKTEWFPFYE